MLSNIDVQNGDSVGSTSVVDSVVTEGDVVSLNGVVVSVSPVLLVELELEELEDELEIEDEVEDELDSSHCSVPMGSTRAITNKYNRPDIVSSFPRLIP